MAVWTKDSDYGVVEVQAVLPGTTTAVDLTGLQVNLRAIKADGTIESRTAITITDADSGIAEYSLVDGDDLFNTVGELKLYMDVILPATGQTVYSFESHHSVVDNGVPETP